MYPRATPYSKPSRKICILPFIRALLDDESNKDIICWTNKSKQEFRLADQKKVAELWGTTKPGRKVKIMSYDNMARSLREFVKANLLEKMEGRTCGYRFVESLAFGIDRILSDDFGSSKRSEFTLKHWQPTDVKPVDISGSSTSGNFHGAPMLTPSPTPSPGVKSEPPSPAIAISPAPSTSSGIFTGSQTPNPTTAPVITYSVKSEPSSSDGSSSPISSTSSGTQTFETSSLSHTVSQVPSENLYMTPISTPTPTPFQTPSPAAKLEPSSSHGTLFPVPSMSSRIFTGSQTSNTAQLLITMSSDEFKAAMRDLNPAQVLEVIRMCNQLQAAPTSITLAEK